MPLPNGARSRKIARSRSRFAEAPALALKPWCACPLGQAVRCHNQVQIGALCGGAGLKDRAGGTLTGEEGTDRAAGSGSTRYRRPGNSVEISRRTGGK